jgi:hypothetical protein
MKGGESISEEVKMQIIITFNPKTFQEMAKMEWMAKEIQLFFEDLTRRAEAKNWMMVETEPLGVKGGISDVAYKN